MSLIINRKIIDNENFGIEIHKALRIYIWLLLILNFDSVLLSGVLIFPTYILWKLKINHKSKLFINNKKYIFYECFLWFYIIDLDYRIVILTLYIYICSYNRI